MKLRVSELWIPLLRGRALKAKSSASECTLVLSRGVVALEAGVGSCCAAGGIAI